MPILESLGVRVGWEIGRQIVTAVPRGLARVHFKRFFGPSALSLQSISAVLDPYEHPQPRVSARFVKRMLGRGPDLHIFGEDMVLGINSMRLVAYASSAFAPFAPRGRSLEFQVDTAAVSSWDRTYLCFGGPDSNLKTYDIAHLPEQSFFRYEFPPGARFKAWHVGGQWFEAGAADHGIVLRMRNPFFPTHLLFVCAGLGEWGSTGAAWYLFSQWEKLYKEYGDKELCLVVSVTPGSDQSARLVHVEERPA